MLCHSVSDACPEVTHRRRQGQLGVDKAVYRNIFQLENLPEGSVLMVEDADLRDRRTVGGNGGYCVDRLTQPVTHHFYRVNTLASSHSQDYIRLLDCWFPLQPLHIFPSCVLSVNHRPCHNNLCLLQGREHIIF